MFSYSAIAKVKVMGFPSPAQDYVEQRVSLDAFCIARPSATYFMRANAGYQEAGIFEGAMLVVDSSLTPVHGSLVIGSPDGEFILCRLQTRPVPALVLVCSGEVLWQFSEADSGGRSEIFGVVTYVINNAGI